MSGPWAVCGIISFLFDCCGGQNLCVLNQIDRRKPANARSDRRIDADASVGGLHQLQQQCAAEKYRHRGADTVCDGRVPEWRTAAL
jgi:hypothetical protein